MSFSIDYESFPDFNRGYKKISNQIISPLNVDKYLDSNGHLTKTVFQNTTFFEVTLENITDVRIVDSKLIKSTFTSINQVVIEHSSLNNNRFESVKNSFWKDCVIDQDQWGSISESMFDVTMCDHIQITDSTTLSDVLFNQCPWIYDVPITLDLPPVTVQDVRLIGPFNVDLQVQSWFDFLDAYGYIS